MKSKIIYLLSFIMAFSATTARAVDEVVTISTNDIQLVYKVDKKNKLRQCYFGEAMGSNAEKVQMTKHDAYPTFGTSYVNEPALRAVHADGNTSTELVYVSHKTEMKEDGVEYTEIALRDSYFPFDVKLCFNAYGKENVIEAWTVISHNEKKPVMLYNYASSHLFFEEKAYYLTQFYGEWADEMHMTEMQLTRGIKSLESKLGVRSNQHAHGCFLLGLDAPAQEDAGRVLGGTLAWPGSFNLTFDVDNLDNLHVICGINSFAGQYQLAKGEVFETPKMLYSYSNNGTGEVTRNFHRWAKKYGIWRGDRTRTTLLNNWEATYFNFNEEILSTIIGDAAEMGFELFLLDDGWFGSKYPRNNDDAGLGDWMVNTKKLPNGIGHLVKEATRNGIKFGIWLEPEMVNPRSELYEKHPDWVITQPNREIDLSRNQLILDLCNPKVQDYVFSVVDNTLKENPGIAYVKWDCNRFVTNSGSFYLSADKQSHLWIEYVRGLYRVFERVRANHPDVSIMLCSGGGGRIDYASLRYFDEFWISDNTDAYNRIFIQWGTTQFFPAMALASHVSASPCHQTGRVTPLKFRFDVAMSAKLGMDVQPMNMTEEEKEFSKNAIKEYYTFREIVQHGDLYRLLSPYTNPRTAMMYVSEDKQDAVVFTYLLEKVINGGNNQVLYLKGLDPNKTYRLNELNKEPNKWSWFNELEGKSYTGEYLMKYGVRFPMYNQFESKIIRLTAE